ncbi:hypothetical protein BLNAU_12768 [Blattamonas nauphoetae]|uniref:Anoctamin transmembrane domain-containing protein n=1 Tax=Blattamonas nauphoetae TaxID=2049346 RepID=A0ABQ9XIW1_9EUKA|nr:hypothetical protein BLNAU_12768 [Blattamonas nauphoetae]
MVISGLIPFEPFHSSSKFYLSALTNADDVELKDLLKLHEASQPIEIVDYMLKTSKDIEKVKQLIMTKLADRRIAFDEQKSVDGKNILLRISAIFEALCIEAERLHIKRFSKKKVTNDDKFGDIPLGTASSLKSERHPMHLPAISVERVAAQFAFNEYLIKSLSILALVGIVVFVLDQLVDVVIIFVRSSIFDRLWRRKNARSLYDTNSLKPTEPDMIRPVFIGKMQFSDITGHTERVYPTRLKVCRTVVSWIVSAIFLALSIAGQWATVFYEADLVSTFHVQADSEAVLFLVRCKPGLINGVLQMVLWSLYGRVASRSGKSVQRGRALQAAHSSGLGHTVIGNLIGSVPVEETSTNTTLRTEEEGAVKNLDDDQSRFNTPTPGMDLMSQDLYSQTQSRLNTMETADDVRGGREERKVEEEGQAVHQNDCGATRADAGAAGEAEGVQEYENEYNKRMSEVEFEQSKGKYDYVQQYLDKLNYILQIAFFTPISPLSSLVALISGVLDTLSARYKLLNTKQHPIPSTRPNTSWMETSITTIIWPPSRSPHSSFSCCVGTGELVSGSPCGDCATASAQIDTEFGAIKLKVGFILIFDDIIGLKMQQSIYLRSEVRHIKLLYVDY